MGLVIFLLRLDERCSVYEIYPQSETPQLTKIARLDLPRYRHLYSYVSPDKIIWYMFNTQGVIFRVWDYRRNASVSFLALVRGVRDFAYGSQVVATQAAIVLLCKDDILIWAIPPLLPHPLDFDDYSPAQFPPEVRIKVPDPTSRRLPQWRIMSSWYFDHSKPFYFDRLYSGRSQYQRFKITIKPDVSDATLHSLNTIHTTHNVVQETTFQPIFCEDNIIYGWSSSDLCGTYRGSTLSDSTAHMAPITKISLAVGRSRHPRELGICPTSGRFVHLDSGRDADKIVVLDFLPHRRSW